MDAQTWQSMQMTRPTGHMLCWVWDGVQVHLEVWMWEREAWEELDYPEPGYTRTTQVTHWMPFLMPLLSEKGI